MEPLKDWYRYVDQVSRPARKDDPGTSEEAAAPWRPWKQENVAEPESPLPVGESRLGPLLLAGKTPTAGEEEITPARVVPPPLFGNLASGVVHAGTFMPAGRHYEDLTVNDTLQPIPEFSVPRLSAPLLEFDAPRIPARMPAEPEVLLPEPPAQLRETVEAIAAPAPSSSPDFRLASPTVTAPAPPELIPVAVVEAPQSAVGTPLSAATSAPRLRSDPAPAEEAERNDKAPRHWDLLTQIRGRDVAQNSYKSPFQETREELVQRLLDPELTLEETARLLDVCPTTVRRYTNKGQLRCFRTPGNQRRFRLSDIVEFMGHRVVDANPELGDDTETDD